MEEKLKVLVVDDNRVNRIILKKIISEKYDPIEACNGEEAIDILTANDDIAAVLLDMKMPVMDGYQFLKEVKSQKRFKSIPVIAITAETKGSEEIKALELGANDFIHKPVAPQIVLTRLDNITRLQQAIKAAETDFLTKLYNRSAFGKYVDFYLENADPKTQKAALYVLDLDDFKHANDTFGHIFGDAVLSEFGEILKEVCGKNAMVSRIGGDEFSILLMDYEDDSQVEQLAKIILKSLSECNVSKFNSLFTCSIGVALYPKDGRNRSELYFKADQALYEAKRLGKNQYTIYGNETPIANKSSDENKEWILDQQDAYIYICDAETHELYYANLKAVRLLRSASKEEPKCFCYLLGLSDNGFEFCANNPLNGIKSYTSVCYSSKLGKKLLYKGKYIKWDERLARMAIVTEME